MEKSRDEINRLIGLQQKYCEKHGPMFAPNNGICYRCNRQIYQRISEKEASSELITGCPYCCWSYVD